MSPCLLKRCLQDLAPIPAGVIRPLPRVQPAPLPLSSLVTCWYLGLTAKFSLQGLCHAAPSPGTLAQALGMPVSSEGAFQADGAQPQLPQRLSLPVLTSWLLSCCEPPESRGCAWLPTAPWHVTTSLALSMYSPAAGEVGAFCPLPPWPLSPHTAATGQCSVPYLKHGAPPAWVSAHAVPSAGMTFPSGPPFTQ